MANFKKFTNAQPPYENQPIYINVDHVVVVLDEVLNENKVTLWCKENHWVVNETLEETMKIINEDKND